MHDSWQEDQCRLLCVNLKMFFVFVMSKYNTNNTTQDNIYHLTLKLITEGHYIHHRLIKENNKKSNSGNWSLEVKVRVNL